jgi:hypothetical protein
MGAMQRELKSLITRQLRHPRGDHLAEWKRIRTETLRRFQGGPESAFVNAYIRDGAGIEEACADAWIERRTGYRYLDDVLVYAALLATDAQIIDPRTGKERS